MKIKGQNFRIKVGSQYIAAATSCSLHIAANLEESTTKDSTGNWSEQEVTGKSWDGQAEAVVVVDAADTTGAKAFDLTELVGTKVTIVYEQTEGSMNRQAIAGGVTYTGEAVINDVSISAPNRQNATYTVQFTGTGALTKAPVPEGETPAPSDPE